MEDPEVKIEDAEVNIVDAEVKMEDSEVKIEESEVNIEESEVKIEDSEVEIEESEVEIEESEVKIEESEVKIEDSEVKIDDSELKIEKSEVKIEESEVKTEASEVIIEESEVKIDESEVKIEDSEVKIEDSEVKIEESEVKIEKSVVKIKAAKVEMENSEAKMEDIEINEWDYESMKRRILQTSPLEDRIVAIEECAHQIKSLKDMEKVTAAQLIILPLSSGAVATLRRSIFANVEYIVQQSKEQSSKYVVGGLLLEMEVISRRLLNAVGSRMAQEEALLWIKVLITIVNHGGDIIQGDITKKATIMAARLATAGLWGKSKPSIENRYKTRINELLQNDQINKFVHSSQEESILVLKICLLPKANTELRKEVLERIVNIITDKKASRRHDLFLLEFASRMLIEQDVKDIAPHFQKQMLRAPEVGCARLSAVIHGTVTGGMDLSNHVCALHESLVKVLIGTDEENAALAKRTLMTMYKACNQADTPLAPITDYLRKVWNGKEGKIAQSTTKADLVSIFGSFATCPSQLRNAAVTVLCACGEKETTEAVLAALFKSLYALTALNPKQEIINTLFDAIQKQSKSSGIGQYGFISAVYGQITPETIAYIDKPKIDLLFNAYEKMEKNISAGCAAAKILQKLSTVGTENIKSDFQTKVVQKLSSQLTPKMVKIICQGPALEEYAMFALNMLHCTKSMAADLRNILLTILVRQFLLGTYNAQLEAEFENVKTASNFESMASIFHTEMSNPSVTEQRCANMSNRIVNLAIRCNSSHVAKDLITCTTGKQLSAKFWRKCVFPAVPSIEPILALEYGNAMMLEGMLDKQFCKQVGILASVSNTFLQKIMKTLLCDVFPDTDSIWQSISISDIAIAQTPSGELYDSSCIASREKTLDKNSKNYEEEKWALDLKRKQDAKKGVVKLTKDQIEAKNRQLANEAEIRSDVLPKLMKFRNAITIINEVTLEHGTRLRDNLGEFISPLVSRLFKILNCPIFDVNAINTVRNLARLCSNEVSLGSYCDSIISISARVVQSKNVEKEWCVEGLNPAVIRVLALSPKQDAAITPYYANVISEFAALSLPLDPMGAVTVLNGIFGKLSLIQSCHVMRVLIRHMSQNSDASGLAASDLLLNIAGSMRKREINLTESAIPLIEGLESDSTSCRSGVLSAVNALHPNHASDANGSKIEDYLSHRIYSARHSQDLSLVTKAKAVMSQLDLFPPDDSVRRLCEDASCGIYHLQKQAASALAELLRASDVDDEAEDYAIPDESCADLADEAIDILIDSYKLEYELASPKYDDVGRLLKQTEDRSTRRFGIGSIMCSILSAATTDKAESVFSLLIPTALNDFSTEVSEEMLQVGIKAIDVHGTNLMDIILPLFENYLQDGKSETGADTARQSVVVLLGRLASHLPRDDPRVKPIVGKLIAALSVPSEQVQKAVALCLPSLVRSIKEDAPQIISGLMDLMLKSQNYAERRGGAQGLAGIVKGLGILSIKKHQIITQLSEAIQDKKDTRRREGALFGFGALCASLGRLFEPYIIQILPWLLEAFGDGNFGVREAAEETAKEVMSSLSAHGVKLVLPSLLKALESDSWRSKVGSVELLGSMAHCAPKQLSACLPQIVPYLIEVLADSHPKVCKAGRQALGQIGQVIRNPEIKSLTPFLLDGLSDPARKISPALTELNNTRFVHHIDAASLALIMPIIQRAFNERSAETRKLSAQIIGGMCSRNQALCSGSDLAPYMPSIMPGLRLTLTDPVPDVRATAAKAIGNVVSITPADSPTTRDLLPWLKSILVSESSAVDRSGAAQGLAEVLYAQGVEELDDIMPQMIKEASDTSLPPTVRDGYCMAFIYFPVVFRDQFAEYVSSIIPALLANLADENEYLRDTALKAGKKIIQLFADTAIALLLPELEQGLLDENWRIRYSSVQLLGDLLFHITGITGKMSSESGGGEDNFGTNEGQKIIMATLGDTCYYRVMAGLYMCRSDIALLVRQAALHVWKLVVNNTARTIREVLPVLIELILQNLASEYDEKRQIASRTLGDLVKKLGERILPKLMPILNKGLQSACDDQRQGVCIGLTEVISAASKDMVSVMSAQLGPTIRAALSDTNAEVRDSAAVTFEMLHNKIGIQAIEEIIPHLLGMLDASAEEKMRALDGLRRIMASKGRSVLPAVLPKLTEKPVNTKTLSFLASAAGEHLSRYVDTVMEALINELAANDCAQHILDDCSILIEGVDDKYGASLILSEILDASKSNDIKKRTAAASLVMTFVQKTTAGYTEYYGVLFRELIRLMADPEGSATLVMAWTSLQTVVKLMDNVELQSHLGSLRQAISFVRKEVDQNGHLPGFSLPKKGINCIVPIFKEGILSGSPDMKEQTAIVLQEVIELTDPSALKPSVVGLAGPLIRVLGDRYGPQVKCPLLSTLELLLTRAGLALKAFLPQLQTTFLKATHDESRQIRLRGAEALGKLALHHSRIEPLVTELRTSLSKTDDPELYTTYTHALRLVVENAGAKISADGKQQIIDLMEENIRLGDSQSRLCSAGVLAATIIASTDQEEMIEDLLEADCVGKIETIAIILKLSPELLVHNDRIPSILSESLKSTDDDILSACLMVVSYLLCYHGENSLPSWIHKALKELVALPQNDIVQRLGNDISWSQVHFTQLANAQLLPYVIMGARSGNMGVKTAFEMCLVCMTRIRIGDQKMDEFLSRVPSGKDMIWMSDFCRVGGKLRRLALTQPIIANPDRTMLIE